MELTFNEISHTPLLEDKHKANERMMLLSKTVAEARKNGFRKIRTHFAANEINLTQYYSMHHWLFDKTFPAENREVFLDMFVQPFMKENETKIEQNFIEANYYFEDAENNIPRQECLGLAAAYLGETIALSFQSNPAWLKNVLKIIIEKDENVSIEDVNHVYSKECFQQNSIVEFIESISTLVLLETEINPNEKKIHLTSHHGQKELNELWSRIKNSPFVVEGLSIAWGGNSFCKNPRSDGKLDIIHLKSDSRYALQIQTTGRNLRETIEIAKRLTEQFG